jgi:uncharacterized protein
MNLARAEEILKKYYPEGSQAYDYLYRHSLAVAAHAVRVAERHPELTPDIGFIHTSALLHDIGIFMTDAPGIGCFGKHPYLAHGYLGRKLLEDEGYPEHALVCERHVGVGISREEVIRRGLPLPHRDMMPVSVEEEIVCYADKFYSKKPGRLTIPESPEMILRKLEKHGPDKPEAFRRLIAKYGLL